MLAARHLSASSFFVAVLRYANNVIVYCWLGEASLGVFLAAFWIIEQLSTVPGLLANVAFPRLAQLVVSAPERAREEAAVFREVLVIAGLGVAGLLAIEAPDVTRVLYGSRYHDAGLALRIMAPALLFTFVAYGYTNVLMPFHQDRVILRVVVVGAVVSVGGGLALVPPFHLLGGAVAVSIADLAAWLAASRDYRRVVGPLGLRSWARPLAGVCLMALICFALERAAVPFWLRAPAALLGYLVAVRKQVAQIIRWSLAHLNSLKPTAA